MRTGPEQQHSVTHLPVDRRAPWLRFVPRWGNELPCWSPLSWRLDLPRLNTAKSAPPESSARDHALLALDDGLLTNQRGQILGAKGQRTRQRMLEATRRLIDTASLSEITSIGIARESGVSIATFYLYFSDVSDAFLALIDDVAAAAPDFRAEFPPPWLGPAALANATAFVDRYVSFSQAHRAVLRVRNLLADEREPRFRAARVRHSMPTIRLLMRQLSGGEPIDEETIRFRRVAAAASMLLAMLERLCEVLADQPPMSEPTRRANAITKSWDRSELIASTARILVATVAAGVWDV